MWLEFYLPKQSYKILILGGYGVFGGRLAQLLSNIENIELIVAGRNRTKAQAFCDIQTGIAKFTPAEIDRADLAEALQTLSPDVIVDASGPFQNYGDDPYYTIRAAIAAGVNYLDFADGSDFVTGVSQFDEIAEKAGVFVLSGVSSFPVLTAAVIRNIGQNMDIHSVIGGIAPSPFAGVGMNVMRAVISYAGGPITLQRNGTPTLVAGLTESMYYTIAPPGMKPLRNIRFSLVDVPDLQVIPAEYPEINNMWMGAGPGPESLHRLLNLLAKIRATLRLPSFEIFSPIFFWVLNHMKFGEHRGGMFIEISGTKDGTALTRSWHLLAEGDDGPFIPSMAIEAIIRNTLDKAPPSVGARPAIHELELNDYEKLFASRTIYTGIRETALETNSLFQRTLGSAFDDLPTSLQKLHTPNTPNTETIWIGRADITQGSNLMAKIIAKLFRFPPSGENVATRVTVSTDANGNEKWQRDFAGRVFNSYLRAGKGRFEHLICESFGPASFALAMVVDNNKLHYIPRNWRVFGIPMPKSLTPNGVTFEEEVDGKFFFDVEIAAPFIGRIVHYRGWLEPE